MRPHGRRPRLRRSRSRPGFLTPVSCPVPSTLVLHVAPRVEPSFRARLRRVRSERFREFARYLPYKRRPFSVNLILVSGCSKCSLNVFDYRYSLFPLFTISNILTKWALLSYQNTYLKGLNTMADLSMLSALHPYISCVGWQIWGHLVSKSNDAVTPCIITAPLLQNEGEWGS